MEAEELELVEDPTLCYEVLETDGEDEEPTEGTQKKARQLLIRGLLCLSMVLLALLAGIGYMAVLLYQDETQSPRIGRGSVEKLVLNRSDIARLFTTPSVARAQPPGKVLEQVVRPPRSSITLTQLEAGDGANFPIEGDLLYVHFVGRLKNGAVFDSSTHGRSDVFRFWFHAAGLIRGWVDGLPRMSLGERVTLEVPAALAYGEERKGKIPPNSDLVFDMQLLGIGAKAYSSLRVAAVKVQGDGAHTPRAGDTVWLYFAGFLPGGKEFTSTRKKPGQHPFRFTLGADQTDFGMEFAVQLLALGERAVVNIPSVLAFGSQGAGPVPPNADLVFDLELVALKRRERRCFDDCGEPLSARLSSGYGEPPDDALRAATTARR